MNARRFEARDPSSSRDGPYEPNYPDVLTSLLYGPTLAGYSCLHLLFEYMKFGLAMLGLLICLTLSISPANAQNVSPPPGGEASYAVPPQVPPGTAPMPMMPAPPQGYADPNQPWPQQGFAPQWGPPPGAPVDPSQMPPQGYPPQGYPPQGTPGPDPAMMAPPGYPPPGYAPAPPPQYDPSQYSPRKLTPYEQQEAALRDAEISGQLEDNKQQKEMEDNFRNGVLAEFEDSKNGGPDSGFNGDQSKVKGGVKKAGSVLKGGMRALAPTASWIGTFFILNAATGGF